MLDVAAVSGCHRPRRSRSGRNVLHRSAPAGFRCDSRPFEDWLHRKRHAYQQAALEALHELAERQLALGKAAISRALALARRQLDLEPWREEAHRQLMRGLALSGDRSGAIAQFDVCSDVLADELGVSPATETFALFEAIRDGVIPARQREGESGQLYPTTSRIRRRHSWGVRPKSASSQPTCSIPHPSHHYRRPRRHGQNAPGSGNGAILCGHGHRCTVSERHLSGRAGSRDLT